MSRLQTFRAVCLILALGVTAPVGAGAVPTGMPECVILLHGLARSDHSMRKLQTELQRAGYVAVNVDYPSRHHTIEVLASTYISRAVADCRKDGAGKIHFVTHSMGGILVRYYLAHTPSCRLFYIV